VSEQNLEGVSIAKTGAGRRLLHHIDHPKIRSFSLSGAIALSPETAARLYTGGGVEWKPIQRDIRSKSWVSK
jgi:hypothetical protein